MPQWNGSGSAFVIVDSEYLFAEQILNTYLTNLLEAAEVFEKLCDRVTNEAITESDIRVGVQSIRDDMSSVRRSLAELRDSLSGQSRAFIQKINDLDQFVY